jgi:hypothetical protein
MGNLGQIKDVASKFVKDEERLDLLSWSILQQGRIIREWKLT